VQERALARVDLGAIERNCGRLRAALSEGAELCAVVKADAYGHGLGPAAGAALAGGASWLGVATAGEAAALRVHLPEARILVMGAMTRYELEAALAADADVAVWRAASREIVAELASGAGRPARVHVKHDSGMGRLGNPDPDEVRRLAEEAASDERLELAGIWTHFATADELEGEGSDYFQAQLERFRTVAEMVCADHPDCLVHAANSAATLREPRSHFDMVRCGVAVYGLDPFGRDPSEQGLAPAMSLESYVADVKHMQPGQSAGYGRRWTADRETTVGVLPIGYGDGVRRGLTNKAEVLVAGRRHPLVGTVSMDNITIELGPENAVEPGAPAMLIGQQGPERILAEELADALETINYEITCGISARVPRVYDG
jgi:alanine racemase